MKYFILIFSLFIISCDDDDIVNTYDDFNLNTDFIGTWQEKYFKNQMNLWLDSEYFYQNLNFHNQLYTYEEFCLLCGSSIQDDICTYEFYQYYILPTSECVEIVNFDSENNFSDDDDIPMYIDCDYDDLGNELEIQDNFEENFPGQITYTENAVFVSTYINDMPVDINYVLINDTLLETSIDITHAIVNSPYGIEGFLQGIPAKGINSIIQKTYYDKSR